MKASKIKYLKKIGEGNFSKVYLAEIQNTKVAVKVLKKNMFNNKLIYQEVNILQRLKHENILLIKEFIETKTDFLIITEFCERGSLRSLIEEGFELDLFEIKYFFQQICSAIHALEKNKIVHRDIKLDNIFITKDYKLKLGDFGFAKCFNETDLLQSVKGKNNKVPQSIWLQKSFSI